MNDLELLHQYTREGSQTAFAALVARHLRLVYSAARRQVGSPDHAGEVAQTVFLELAAAAGKLRADTQLVSWLYVATRRTAVDLIRREASRQKRDQIVGEVFAVKESASSWAELEPLVDEAIGSLDEPDRQAILLRFVENQSLREIGRALGASEDAVQKRVSRALERLRAFFAKRGVATTAAALAADLPLHAVEAVPAGLTATISAALASAPAAGVVVAQQTVRTVLSATIQKTLLGVATAALAGFLVFQTWTLQKRDREIAALKARSVQLRLEGNGLRALRDRALERERLAASLVDAATTGDPEFDARIRALLVRVAFIKKVFEVNPTAVIPEQRFLTELDWITAMEKYSRLESEEDIRRAMSTVRASAVFGFAPVLQSALKAFVKEADGILPNEVGQLGPYFDPPIDPAILTRYEMRASGRADAQPKYSAEIVVEKLTAIVDRKYDGQGLVGFEQFGWLENPDPKDHISVKIETEEDLAKFEADETKWPAVSNARSDAIRSFRAAHHGAYPQAAEDLVPFFLNPEHVPVYLNYVKQGHRY